MRYSFAIVAAAAVAVSAKAIPGGVTADITPTGAAPAGCTGTYPLFELSVVTVSKKVKRSTSLEVELTDGILTDSAGRRGYIASNDQFQFDAPPVQAGAIYTGGFSVCANGTLALGDSAIWYECLSGTFYNLYDEDVATQCTEIFLDTIKVASSSDSSSVTSTTTVSSATATASVSSTSADLVSSTATDGQVIAGTTTKESSTTIAVTTAAATTSTSSADIVSTISDNQIQAGTTTTAVSTSTSNSTVAATSVAAYTGAASLPTMAAEVLLAAAGVAALML